MSLESDLKKLELSSKKEAINLVHQGFLPKLDFGEDRPYTKVDVVKSLNDRLDTLNKLYSILLEKQLDFQDPIIRKSFLVPLFVLCGENVQPSEWTSAKIIETSYLILTFFKTEIFKSESIQQVLQNEPEFCKNCLKILQEKLTKNEWKSFPGAQFALSWMLRQVEVAKYWAEFLPFILRFLDDWEMRNKVLALHCLDHVLDNVDGVDLNKFGYGQVIKSALFHVQVHRELSLLQIAFKCTFKFLSKTVGEKDLRQGKTEGIFTQNFSANKFDDWDELTKKLLYSLETESDSSLKQFYMHQLKQLLAYLQLASVRWLSRILSIVSNETQILQNRLLALEILQKVVEICADRVKFHAEIIYQTLITLLYDSTVDEKVFELSIKVLRATAQVSQDEFQEQFQGFFLDEQCDADRVVGEILTELK